MVIAALSRWQAVPGFAERQLHILRQLPGARFAEPVALRLGAAIPGVAERAEAFSLSHAIATTSSIEERDREEKACEQSNQPGRRAVPGHA